MSLSEAEVEEEYAVPVLAKVEEESIINIYLYNE
jgi:hypothetical protein